MKKLTTNQTNHFTKLLVLMIATLLSAGQLNAQGALPPTAAGIASVEAADLEKASQIFAPPLGRAKNGAGTNQSPPIPPRNLRFEANVGQFDEQILFRANDAQATHFFLDGEIRTTITGAENTEGHAYGMEFLAPSVKANLRAIGGRGRGNRTNYINARGSFSDVPMHRRLHYENLWEGISTHFFESNGRMKYDFIVGAGADPGQVRFLMKGVENLRTNAEGELEFDSPLGQLQKGVPFTYQMVNGNQVAVSAAYNVSGDTISFELGAYDNSLPLTIDPIALKYSAYLGTGDFQATDSYYDPSSDLLYVAGSYQTSYPGPTGSVPDLGPFNTSSSDNAVIMAMEADGSAVLWTLRFGGTGRDYAEGIYRAPGGDLFVRGRTSSVDFPVNGAVAAFDATHNGGFYDEFLMRFSADGTTLLYSSFFGGSASNSGDNTGRGIVVQGDVVYGSTSISVAEYPQLPAATYTSSSAMAAIGGSATAVYAINTAVAGPAGFEGMALYGNDSYGAYDISSDGAGNIYVIGVDYNGYNGGLGDNDFTADAVQTFASVTAASSDATWLNGNYVPFVAKFNPALDQLLYASLIHPVFALNYDIYAKEEQRLVVNDAGDMFIFTDYWNDGYNGVGAPSPLQFGPTTGEVRDYSNSDYSGGDYSLITAVVNIPAANPSAYSYISLLGGEDFGADVAGIDYDDKGRAHVLNYQYTGSSSENYAPYPSGVSTTPGAVLTDDDLFDQGSYDRTATYTVFSPTGVMEYNTLLPTNGENWRSGGHTVSVDKEDCTAYLFTDHIARGGVPFLTPSYLDQETGLQVNVANATTTRPPENAGYPHIVVFHEPEPNDNTISDFLPGNDMFCVGSLIYQDPNDGPILGEEVTYTSGDGSSLTHNLPLLFQSGVPSDHPTPASPQYQWQISRDGGAWENIIGGDLAVLKPDAETTAGMVEYRRAVISGCCDTIFSNIADATIAGALDLIIDAPAEPVYYCEGSVTDLGITISGASGNISWQWYNGFDPITDAEINPASGSGVAEGSFVAEIPVTQSSDGFYRLVVTDAGGCKRESSVSIAKLTDDAFVGTMAPLCPDAGGDFVELGPSVPNPAFDYSWTGPGGFTSTEANPSVNTVGDYMLQVSVAGQNMFCAGGQTSVTVLAGAPHDPALVPLVDQTVCQSDDPIMIGLAGTPPAGYVFQWSTGVNLDNNLLYNPTFDPGSLPFGITPVAVVDFTFTALREDDGCIYEDVVQVTDIKLAFANAGPDEVACDNRTIGRANTTGFFFQWEALETTYGAGLAALIAEPDFSIDGANVNLGTKKYATVRAPIDEASDCYDVTYVLRSSYVPFPNTCFSTDTVNVIYCCGEIACPVPETDIMGTEGSCGGENTIVTVDPTYGLSVEWTTYSVDGVVQADNTPPQGLFTVVDSTQGVAITPTGPHPNQVVANFDDPTWGWAGANFVVYEVRFYGEILGLKYDCTDRLQVFSGQNATPLIGLIDPSFCDFPEGTQIGTSPTTPYLVSGLDYNVAPNSTLDWQWSTLDGNPATSVTANAMTPFPTIEPTGSVSYLVTASDPATGCTTRDTMMVTIVDVIADAGPDITTVCDGSLVQLGSDEQPNHNYVWSPVSGLNFPIGTTNNTTAEPFLTVPSAPAGITYTVTVTETTTGCQAVDEVTITTNTDPPVQPSPQTFTQCSEIQVERTIALTGSALPGHTYEWSVFSGGGSLAWFSDPLVYEPTVNIPAGTPAGNYVFRITITKGNCGSVTQDVTFIVQDPPIFDLGPAVAASCEAPFTALSFPFVAGYRFRWFPAEGLFRDAALTVPYNGGSSSIYNVIYVEASSVQRVYTMYATNTSRTGCDVFEDIVILPSAPDAVDAGEDASFCPGSAPLSIGVANSGTSHEWTATGFNADPAGTPAAPTAGEGATMLSYLTGTTSNITNFAPPPSAAGVYIYTLTSMFANGCTFSDEILIRVPNLASGFAGTPTAVCLGESVQIGLSPTLSGYSYNWRALNPVTESYTISDPASARPFMSPVVTTSYEVTATDNATGCEVVETVLVTVVPVPVIANASVAVACAPIAPVDLTAQILDYGTYFNPIWYTNSAPGAIVTDPTAVMPDTMTNYFLVAENASGCTDTAIVAVNVDNPLMPLLPSSVTTNCGPKTFDLSTLIPPTPSTAGGVFEWHSANDTDAASLLTDLVVSSGTYYLFETTANGCESPSAPLVVITPNCFDLALTKMLAPGQSPSVFPGDDVTFIITVYNQGNVAADNIAIVDYPPTGMVLNDTDWNADNTITLSAPTNLPAGGLTMANGPATIEVTYTVDVGVVAPITLVNQAEITSALNLVTGVTQMGDADAFFDNDPTNNPGGAVTTDSDDSVDGDGFGLPGDTDATTDADNADPAQIMVIPFEPVSLGDTVWVDLNNDGLLTTGEPGIGGVTVTVYDNATGMPVTLDSDGAAYTAMTMTNPDGGYSFDNLPAGDYYVVFDITTADNAAFYDYTTQNAGDDTLDSDADPTTGQTAPTGPIPSGGEDLTLDAGVVCITAVTVASPTTICSSRTIDLTQGASILPAALGGLWSSTGNGTFTTGADFATATTYTPGSGDIAAGQVTLTLTSNDPNGPCPVVTASVTFTILKVDCGAFPWSGE